MDNAQPKSSNATAAAQPALKRPERPIAAMGPPQIAPTTDHAHLSMQTPSDPTHMQTVQSQPGRTCLPTNPLLQIRPSSRPRASNTVDLDGLEARVDG
jgi:hypothetical protein